MPRAMHGDEDLSNAYAVGERGSTRLEWKRLLVRVAIRECNARLQKTCRTVLTYLVRR